VEHRRCGVAEMCTRWKRERIRRGQLSNGPGDGIRERIRVIFLSERHRAHADTTEGARQIRAAQLLRGEPRRPALSGSERGAEVRGDRAWWSHTVESGCPRLVPGRRARNLCGRHPHRRLWGAIRCCSPALLTGSAHRSLVALCERQKGHHATSEQGVRAVRDQGRCIGPSCDQRNLRCQGRFAGRVWPFGCPRKGSTGPADTEEGLYGPASTEEGHYETSVRPTRDQRATNERPRSATSERPASTQYRTPVRRDTPDTPSRHARVCDTPGLHVDY